MECKKLPNSGSRKYERSGVMSMTPEVKKYIVEQIESVTSPRPLFYMKFCSCEKFAQDVCNGDFYGNTADFFRRREIETGERGQGDQFELMSLMQPEDITVIDRGTSNVLFTAPRGTFKLQFREDDLIPIICFVGIRLGDMHFIEADETHADFRFPFTDDEYEIMTKRFGEYCVLLDAREVEERIEAFCNHFKCQYVFDKVEYCSQNSIDRIQAFNKRSKVRFLYKNSDLEYQREYRLAVGIEIPDDHFVRMGKFCNAKIFKSEVLKNTILSISYASYPKEELIITE